MNIGNISNKEKVLEDNMCICSLIDMNEEDMKMTKELLSNQILKESNFMSQYSRCSDEYFIKNLTTKQNNLSNLNEFLELLEYAQDANDSINQLMHDQLFSNLTDEEVSKWNDIYRAFEKEELSTLVNFLGLDFDDILMENDINTGEYWYDALDVSLKNDGVNSRLIEWVDEISNMTDINYYELKPYGVVEKYDFMDLFDLILRYI